MYFCLEIETLFIARYQIYIKRSKSNKPRCSLSLCYNVLHVFIWLPENSYDYTLQKNIKMFLTLSIERYERNNTCH